MEVIAEPESLVAEVSYRGELWAALVKDDQSVRLQTYPRSAPGRVSDKWTFDYEEALEHLIKARQRLDPDSR